MQDGILYECINYGTLHEGKEPIEVSGHLCFLISPDEASELDDCTFHPNSSDFRTFCLRQHIHFVESILDGCSACSRPPPPWPHKPRLQLPTSQFSLNRPRPIPRVPSTFVYTFRSLLPPGHSSNNLRIKAQGWASQVAVIPLIKFIGTERSVREREAESLTNVTVPPALVPADGNTDDDAAFGLELPQPQFSQSDAHLYPHTLSLSPLHLRPCP
jgi:hypothetical protein